MSDAVLQTTIKAFDEFTASFQKFQSELKKTEQAEKETAQGTDQANRSVSNFLQTIGNIGALYVFQRGLKDIIGTGREFELVMKQAQAVTGDFSATLRDLAMATKGGNLDMFGPTQLAEAYRELGAAGATTNEIIASTPHILEFGSAALLNMEQSAYGVLAAAKSFNIDLSDSGQIVDAYTEAMNLGALAGEDFARIMGSAGAVAKLAGQDFREILSVGSALRDAGVSADEAGTSIKSALMAIINPSKEASELMQQLGINIYDASGNMKQWSDITAEFEKALGPYNEQSKQLMLSTVFGSYGIRAMATSLNKGSDYLKTFTEGLKDADGATHEMATAMSNTYDGAARQFNASLERTKILLFEDVAPAAGAALDSLNTLLLGVQSLDEGTRHFIEILVGGAGLVMALSAVTAAVRTLLPILTALGISTSALTGPIGIVIAALGVASTALINYKGAVAKAVLEEGNHIRSIEGQIKTIPNLVKQHEELSKKTNRTAAEEETLKQVTEDLAGILPEAIKGFDSFGQAMLDTGNLADIAKGKIASLKDEVIGYYKLRAEMAKEQLPGLNKEYDDLSKQLEPLKKQLAINQSGKWDISVFGKTYTNPLAGKMGDSDYVQSQIRDLRTEQSDLYKERLSLEQDLAIYESVKNGSYWDKPSTNNTPDNSSTAGTQSWTTPSGSSSKNKTADAAKAYTEAINELLHPYKASVDAVTNSVGLLSAKEQYLAQVMESGNGTINDAVELNKVRTMQYGQLTQQQEALHKQAEAERLALVELQNSYANATNADAAKELRNEIDNLTQSIAQSSQAWWQAEQQKLTVLSQSKAAEEQRYQDAYQKATALMRHQVNMAGMSTSQQISYLTKLKNAHRWTTQQMWDLEEQMYSLRKKQLSDYLSDLETDYRDALDKIDAKTKSTVEELQTKIDALSDEDTDADRNETTYQHNQKIAQLQKERQYHELRTGKEHAQAIADIDEQIAEENRKYQLTQDKWIREDKKASYEQQIEDAEETGEEERKLLEAHYNRVMSIMNNGAIDTLAVLSAKDSAFQSVAVNWMQSMMTGIESKEPEFRAKISKLLSQLDAYEKEVSSNTTPEPDITDSETVPTNWSDKLVYYQSHLNEALAEIKRAGDVYASKWAAGDREGAATAHKWADQIRKAIGMSMVWDQNTEPSPSVHNSYDKGGYIFYDQIAQVHKGEYILPANIVEAIRLMTPPPSSPSSDQSNGGTVIHNEQYFNAPLVGIEKQYMNDDTDSYVLARDTVGLISSARRSSGG